VVGHLQPEAGGQGHAVGGSDTPVSTRLSRAPPHTYTLIRRVRVDAEQISTDARSRRRRTIAADQRTLALGGQLDHVWATSFIVTNLPTGGEGFDTATEVEAWFRSPRARRSADCRS